MKVVAEGVVGVMWVMWVGEVDQIQVVTGRRIGGEEKRVTGDPPVTGGRDRRRWPC